MDAGGSPSGDPSPGSPESSRRGLGTEERETPEERPGLRERGQAVAAGEGRWLRGCMEPPAPEGGGGGPGLSADTFPLLFDSDGRLVRESQFRKLIFKEGGVDPSIRKDVWKFLFGMYPCTSTTRERKTLALELYVRYKMMKCRWQALMPSSRRMRVDETDTELHEAAFTYQQTGGACNLKGQEVDLSEEKSEQMTFIELQAKVYVDRQRINVHELHEAIRIIDKDVPRTERVLDYYQNEGVINLMVLRDILITFAAFHPDVSYAQGMNDLVSRFLEVLDSEVDAYWCSTFYFEKMSFDFKEEGLIRKIKGKIRPELPSTNNDYTFELFICAAILLEKKQLLLKCADEVELIQFTNGLQGALNLDRVLERAEQAFFNYCNKSVMDCFKKLCTEPKKKGFFSFKLMDLFS
ncbi:TBC1 domain family member 15 isoform X5 [Scyliorhinus torazame]|uniref:TBC1 domain family member 15 isoform X5 n=1 Tax=Scyliorhinus torazame TaxID=75743 RepID=UPI003B5A2AD3